MSTWSDWSEWLGPESLVKSGIAGAYEARPSRARNLWRRLLGADSNNRFRQAVAWVYVHSPIDPGPLFRCFRGKRQVVRLENATYDQASGASPEYLQAVELCEEGQSA